MIKMTRGTYGYWDGTILVPKNKKSEPFSLSFEKEKRLVDRGVAEYVGEPPTNENQNEDGQNEDDEILEYDENTKLPDLKEIASKYNIDTSKMRKKEDVIKAIEEALAEAAPIIGVADPVGE